MNEQIEFPNTFEEFAEQYSFKDKDEVYTNGSDLIPVFRVQQWLVHKAKTERNFYTFLLNQINPNELEKYLEMFNSTGEKGE